MFLFFSSDFWMIGFLQIIIIFWYFSFILLASQIQWFFKNWIYQSDTDYQNYTGFRCTILQHIKCTLYCVFPTPSQISIHHCLSPQDLLHLLRGSHHTVVCVHEFFLSLFIFYRISPPPHRCQLALYLWVCLYFAC